MNFADQEEIAERIQRRRKLQRREAVWGFFSGLTLFIALLVAVTIASLFIDPSLPFNPFPPPTLPLLATGQHATPTLYVMPATATQTVPAATETPLPTSTATVAPSATHTVVLTADPNALYPFVLKSDPIPMSNLVFHPDADCNWQGIAGQVVDMQGRAVVGLSVHLTGTYGGRAVDMSTLSGAAQAWYGESGFEFMLGNSPIASQGELQLQLSDQGMVAVSAPVTVTTFDSCDKNLVLVNFRQIR